ncbi:MAG: bifunctional 5,10-methylenetetrahydrofolate dehydrogenase/5,10-methenyltetrahydrofolate cyclohydrolase [Patescibacteria group bacterium]|nr:bifunctional 5,10-methylenetetrahydrofolate dehydrogenase/5,10-methenyltetrahydrofolate cyclohydrolase [Patescibacteria group bacterium]
MTKIIRGKDIAQALLDSAKAGINKLSVPPKLVIISYNANKASSQYISLKTEKAAEVGIECAKLDWSSQDLDSCKLAMQKLASDGSVDGIIVQLPVTGLDNFQDVLNLIPASKDVDGLSEASLISLKENKQVLIPATPKAILEIIEKENIELNNKNILIIGQGKLVGLPLGIILKNKRLNITTADASTNNLSDLTIDADIIITATGSPKLLTGNMVKDGVIVLDAGAAESDGRTIGDVEYESVEPKCSLISKVPGGIGPVTVACLLQNVVEASKNSQ